MAFDAFLKVDGIDGESKDSVHTNEIQIEAFGFGEAQPGSFGQGSGGGTGKVNIHDMTFSGYVSKASPALMQACAAGDHKSTAVLSLRKAGGGQQDYLVVTLTDVLISSYHATLSSGGDDSPKEVFSLNFAQITYQYSIQQDDGSVVAVPQFGWNQSQNAPVQ